uniref:transcription factor 25-like n=1 Tax=Styela clava TaxID=7725 RepID=UPI00193AAED9|nr:transcription factor 25-like [Styela clava]
MSTRVLRKLHGRDDELKNLAALAAVESSEEEDSSEQTEKPSQERRNLFDLLNDENEDVESDESTNIDKDENVNENIEKPTPIQTGARKKTKKKKKNVAKKNKKDEEEDIEKVVNEIAQMENNKPNRDFSNHSVQVKKYKYVLTVEHRFLNPDNELKRIFGTRTLLDDANFRQRNRVKTLKGTWLTSPTSNWPRLTKCGLSMTCLEKSQKYQYFTFEHSKEYQKAQFEFLDAVDSSDHNQIAEVLRLNNYHVDSLLGLSDVCRMSDDTQMARELIERALYALEMNFHSQFNLATGTCRLQYKRQENRCLFLALYRHLHFVFQRGCGRTALELSKILLNLDSDEDPLCVLLFIDFFALQAGEYDFLLQLFSEWEGHKNLSQLPNFAYSVAMANFELSSAGNKNFDMADTLLQDALIKFPSVLMLLLEKCSVQPDKKVSGHSFFTTEAEQTSPAGLKLLCNLFVARNHSLWKSPEVFSWLEKNVNIVLDKVDAKDPEIAKWRQRRKRYQKPPRNIYRYAMICELPGVIDLLPPEIRLEQVFGHDPLPPADGIRSYERPERARRGRTGNSLGLFLHSLMPQFDPSQETEEEGAAALQPGQAGLHQQFQALMVAMRDMLGNLNLQRDDNEEAQEQEEFYEDEWD